MGSSFPAPVIWLVFWPELAETSPRLACYSRWMFPAGVSTRLCQSSTLVRICVKSRRKLRLKNKIVKRNDPNVCCIIVTIKTKVVAIVTIIIIIIIIIIVIVIVIVMVMVMVMVMVIVIITTKLSIITITNVIISL